MHVGCPRLANVAGRCDLEHGASESNNGAQSNAALSVPGLWFRACPAGGLSLIQDKSCTNAQRHKV